MNSSARKASFTGSNKMILINSNLTRGEEMRINITSKQFKQLWKTAIEQKSNNTRLKDRAWSVCQVIQFLGNKEHNSNLIKELGL